MKSARPAGWRFACSPVLLRSARGDLCPGVVASLLDDVAGTRLPVHDAYLPIAVPPQRERTLAERHVLPPGQRQPEAGTLPRRTPCLQYATVQPGVLVADR